MLKNTLFLILFLLTGELYAQIEIKTSPQLWLLKTFGVGLEYGIKPNLGVEVEYQRFQNNTKSIFASNANVGFLGLKYYFVKDKKVALSNFYVGGYTYYMNGTFRTRTKETPLTMNSFGGTGGFKGTTFNNHFIFEAGLNLGKRFTYENGELAKASTPTAKFFYMWDISLRLLLGYRF